MTFFIYLAFSHLVRQLAFSPHLTAKGFLGLSPDFFPCDSRERLQHPYDPDLDMWLWKGMSEELFSHIGTAAVLHNNLANENLTNVKTDFWFSEPLFEPSVVIVFAAAMLFFGPEITISG